MAKGGDVVQLREKGGKLGMRPLWVASERTPNSSGRDGEQKEEEKAVLNGKEKGGGRQEEKAKGAGYAGARASAIRKGVQNSKGKHLRNCELAGGFGWGKKAKGAGTVDNRSREAVTAEDWRGKLEREQPME